VIKEIQHDDCLTMIAWLQMRRDTMVREILRKEVRRLVADAEAQLVEVLPAREYEEEHLPGTIHLPLTKLMRETAVKPRCDRLVIVYASWTAS
jgi:rhodanese-related sulfurtransferase